MTLSFKRKQLNAQHSERSQKCTKEISKKINQIKNNKRYLKKADNKKK